MNKKQDFINKNIKDLLLPVIEKDGFRLYKPKLAMRISKPFVDCIGFQMSRYGNRSFHVHYYRNLISNPLLDMDSYKIGSRLSNNDVNGDDRDWIGDTEENARESIKSVIIAYKNTMATWFATVKSMSDYVFEVAATHHGHRFDGLEDAVAFALGGKVNRAWWICSEMQNNESHKVEESVVNACKEFTDACDEESLLNIDSDNTDPQILAALSDIQMDGSAQMTVAGLLNTWSNRNIERLGLDVK